MSDIAIRFDGLLLAGWLAVAALIFLVAAAAMALGRLPMLAMITHRAPRM